MADARQYELALIPHAYEGEVIQQQQTNGYINATAMCKAAEKSWADYNRLASTKAFITELSSEVGIPITELIQSVTGGNPQLQGTWIHPQVAIHLAQWLSPKFAVRVSQWVYEWMSGMGSPASARRSTPIFVQRYNANWNRVDSGYFSVLAEFFIRIYGRLEHAGHVVLDQSAKGKELRPDISVGLLFPKWLEERHPGLCDKYKLYNHELPNGMVVEARQYHNSVLPSFIEYLETDWLPNRSATYFKTRDPAALAYLPKMLTSA